jgi:catechol 2,3-dioxygenase-like lactoylglutathione lyase family enzyme
MIIKGLHHNAYRCRNAEETRAFYEDFLGLPLVNSFVILTTQTGRKTETLHFFHRMGDGACLAFFEAPDLPFEFKIQHDFDLHISLRVERPALESMRERGLAAGIETRGVIDHGLFESVYFRDPNGYVIELTCDHPGQAAAANAAKQQARSTLTQWQAARAQTRGAGSMP